MTMVRSDTNVAIQSPPDGSAGHAAGDASDERAKTRVEEVDIDRLTFGYSPRMQAEDHDHASMLATAFDRLPPILVHASSMQVIDGVHRILAARMLGHRRIKALFFHGTESEAYVQAVQSNVAHGKPLTRTEREKAALRVLGVHSDWSDRRIATICGIAPGTVGGLRARVGHSATQPNARVGRDGKVRPADPGNTRLRVADALHADPQASVREIAQRTGASKRTVSDVRARVQRGDDVLPLGLRKARGQEISGNGQEPPSTSVSTEESAYLSDETARDFAQWFEAHRVDDGDMLRFVEAIPISRIYEIADVARRCGDAWRQFASELEARANHKRRRSRVTS